MSLDPMRLHSTQWLRVDLLRSTTAPQVCCHARWAAALPWTGTALSNMEDRDWPMAMISILNRYTFQSCVSKSWPLANKSFHCITFRVTKHSQIRHAWLFNAAICPWIMITWRNVGTLGLMTTSKFVSSVTNFLGI